MVQHSSRFQKETDEVIKKYLENEKEIEKAGNEHGIPFRVDSSGYNWKFPDNFTLSIKKGISK